MPSGAPLYEWNQSFESDFSVRNLQAPEIIFPKRQVLPSRRTGYRWSSADHIQEDSRTSGSRFSAREYAADHAPVINALLAANISRQKRFNLCPLVVRQPKQVSSHDAPPKSGQRESPENWKINKIIGF
jgi:hypothetical protein